MHIAQDNCTPAKAIISWLITVVKKSAHSG